MTGFVIMFPMIKRERLNHVPLGASVHISHHAKKKRCMSTCMFTLSHSMNSTFMCQCQGQLAIYPSRLMTVA